MFVAICQLVNLKKYGESWRNSVSRYKVGDLELVVFLS